MLQDVQPAGQLSHPSNWFLLLARVRAQNWGRVRSMGYFSMITRLLLSRSRDVLVWLYCFWICTIRVFRWGFLTTRCYYSRHLWFSLTATIGLHGVCSSMQVTVSWMWGFDTEQCSTTGRAGWLIDLQLLLPKSRTEKFQNIGSKKELSHNR